MNTVEFLYALFGSVSDGYVEVTYIAPEGVTLFPSVVVQWAPLPLGEIDPELPQVRAMNRKGYGAYVAPAVRAVRHPAEQRTSKRGNPYTFYPRGKASDARYVTALWVDVDDASQDAWDRLNSALPYPSIVISSGGGWHAYWMLTEPMRVTVENHGRIKQTLKGMALACGGDTAVADLARVMRLPGTINTKPSRGGVIAEVTDYLPARFNYAELEMGYAPLAAPKEPRVLRHIPVEASNGLPEWVTRYLEHGESEGNRNRRLFAAAVEYKANGLSQSQAEQDLGQRAAADGLDHEEIMRTITSAFSFEKATVNISDTAKYKMAIADTLRQRRGA